MLALGVFEQVRPGETHDSMVRTVASWMERGPNPLIATGAPLGWPMELARVLRSHQAGAPAGVEANEMLRRIRDRIIECETGKLRLDVGADRIGRPARRGLELQQALRICGAVERSLLAVGGA